MKNRSILCFYPETHPILFGLFYSDTSTKQKKSKIGIDEPIRSEFEMKVVQLQKRAKKTTVLFSSMA